MIKFEKKKVKSINFGEKHKPDFLIFFIVFTLNILGLVFVLSSSLPLGQRLYRDPEVNLSTPYFFFFSQLRSFIVGLGAFFFGFLIPAKFFRKFSLYLMIFTFVALFIVAFIPPLSLELNGARRWLNLRFITFQPSEIGKIAVIMYLASIFESNSKQIKSFTYGFIPFLILISVISFLIILQPDLGTLALISIIATIMFFAAGADILHLTLMGGGAIIALWYAIQYAPYRIARIRVWLNPLEDASGEAYQFNQAILAVSTGGWWGRGLGQSRQASFLPEAFSDGIFAIISEELGLVKASLVILLYVLLAWRGYKIASGSSSKFVKLASIGITSWIVVQAFMNISAITGLIPLTGLPLPFISFGGSSLAVLMLGSGILFNLSQYSEK